MGPQEIAQRERVKQVKAALYDQPAPAELPEKAVIPRSFYVTYQPCDPDCAWVQAMKEDPIPKVVRIEDVKRVVCKRFMLNHRELVGSSRNRRVVRPRQIGMYLCREVTQRSLPEIGRKFGNRDHTTVLHALRKIKSLIEVDGEIAETVTVLKRRLGC